MDLQKPISGESAPKTLDVLAADEDDFDIDLMASACRTRPPGGGLNAPVGEPVQAVSNKPEGEEVAG